MKRMILTGLIVAAGAAGADEAESVTTFIRCLEKEVLPDVAFCEVILGNEEPRQCVAYDAAGDPIGATRWNGMWDAPLFSGIEPRAIADVRCRAAQ